MFLFIRFSINKPKINLQSFIPQRIANYDYTRLINFYVASKRNLNKHILLNSFWKSIHGRESKSVLCIAKSFLKSIKIRLNWSKRLLTKTSQEEQTNEGR